MGNKEDWEEVEKWIEQNEKQKVEKNGIDILELYKRLNSKKFKRIAKIMNLSEISARVVYYIMVTVIILVLVIIFFKLYSSLPTQ